MVREPLIVTCSQTRWIVCHEGKQLGFFRFRSHALRSAVEAAYWSGAWDERLDVFVHDREGRVYRAWKGARDFLSLSLSGALAPRMALSQG